MGLDAAHGCEGAPERAREGAWAGRGRAEVVAGLQPVGEHVLGDGPPASPPDLIHEPFCLLPGTVACGEVSGLAPTPAPPGALGMLPLQLWLAWHFPVCPPLRAGVPLQPAALGQFPVPCGSPRALCLHMSLVFYILTL